MASYKFAEIQQRFTGNYAVYVDSEVSSAQAASTEASRQVAIRRAAIARQARASNPAPTKGLAPSKEKK